MKIPKIIHQIWSEKYTPLPDSLKELTESWKEFHPDWKYILWNDEMISDFLQNKYPHYLDIYKKFPHDVQRWDAIRFLIIYEYGGLYIDVDYWCLKNVESLLKRDCCLAQEPSTHLIFYPGKKTITNAFIGAIPKVHFLKRLVQKVWDEPLPSPESNESDFMYCLRTTSLGLITQNYHNYQNKQDIYIIPEELISPIDKYEIVAYHKHNIAIPNAKERLDKAFGVHFFSGTWVSRLK